MDDQPYAVLLKSSSGENQTHLESSKEEAKRERDNIREELQKTKDKLSKEKEDLQAEQEELMTNMRRAQKAREELEEKMSQQQEDHGRAIHLLRKHLLQHVRDMHVWKVFLDQDREYESEDLHVVMEPELESMPFDNQVVTLDTAVTEENDKLDVLLKQKQEEEKETERVTKQRKVGRPSEKNTSSSTITMESKEDDKKLEKEKKKKAAKK